MCEARLAHERGAHVGRACPGRYVSEAPVLALRRRPDSGAAVLRPDDDDPIDDELVAGHAQDRDRPFNEIALSGPS